MFGWAWIYLGFIVVLIGYAATVYFHGFGALIEMIAPYSSKAIINLIVVLVTLAPGFILIKLAEAIEHGPRRRTLLTLISFPVAATISVGMFWFALVKPLRPAEVQRSSATCTDYRALPQDQKVSVAYGYLEGVQAALDKDVADIIVPPSNPEHPMWWVLPNGLGQNPYTGLAQRLDAQCQVAESRNQPLLNVFLSLAHQKEGFPAFGITNDKKKTDPWRQFLGGSVSCSAYNESPEETRQAIVYGYYLGTEALKIALKSKVDIGITWPSRMSVPEVRAEVDKGCRKEAGASLRDTLWVTTVELGVKGDSAKGDKGPQPKKGTLPPGSEPRSFTCKEPLPVFTLGATSNPSNAEVEKLCACVWSKLPEGGWERTVSTQIRKGEDPGWRGRAFPSRFGAALDACGGRGL